MPAYNAARTLRRTYDEVMAQEIVDQIIVVDDNEFTNVGLGSRNKIEASLKFHGVQKLHISNSNWTNSAPLELFLTNGEPITEIRDVVMDDTGPIRANNNEYEIDNVVYR